MGDSMVGEFGAGGVVAAFDGETLFCSSPPFCFPGEQIRVPDNADPKVDSKPPEKSAGSLIGVGARRSGKGCTMGYVRPVKVLGYTYEVLGTHRRPWDI